MEEDYSKKFWEWANEDLIRAKNALNIRDWTDAVYKAQQAVEKGFKSIGIKFLKLTEDDLIKNYSHKTLKLYGDIIKFFIENIGEQTTKNIEKTIKDLIEKGEKEEVQKEIALIYSNLLVNFTMLYFFMKLNVLANNLPKEFDKLEDEKLKIWKISMGIEKETQEQSDFLKELENSSKDINAFFNISFRAVGLDKVIGNFEELCKSAATSSSKNDLENLFGNIESGVNKLYPKANLNLKAGPLYNDSMFNVMKLFINLKEDVKNIAFLDAHESMSRYPKESKEFNIKELYEKNNGKITELVERAEYIMKNLESCLSNI